MHQWQDVSADGGLAPGQSNLGDTLGDEEGGEIGDLGSGEKMRCWGQGHAFLWHAVCTAKIAAFGNANAEVVMLAGEVICQEGGKRLGSFDFLFTCLRFNGSVISNVVW